MSAGIDILTHHLHSPAVVIGIGNRWRGDDAAGPCVVDRIGGRISARCIDAGNAPERHLGEAVAAAPTTVVFVDAVDFGGSPGEIAVFEAEDLPARFGTTHDAPLRVLMRYTEIAIMGKVILVGIQPMAVRLGAPISSAVEASVTAVADLLIGMLGSLSASRCTHCAPVPYLGAEERG